MAQQRWRHRPRRWFSLKRLTFDRTVLGGESVTGCTLTWMESRGATTNHPRDGNFFGLFLCITCAHMAAGGGGGTKGYEWRGGTGGFLKCVFCHVRFDTR